MKLRICENSIRLRLSQSEVKRLADQQTIEMRTDLFPQPLICQLAPSEPNARPSVTFEQGILRADVPLSQLRTWAATQQVGIELPMPGASGGPTLNLLIEKDFKCLHGEAEGQEDCFTNPLAATE